MSYCQTSSQYVYRAIPMRIDVWHAVKRFFITPDVYVYATLILLISWSAIISFCYVWPTYWGHNHVEGGTFSPIFRKVFGWWVHILIFGMILACTSNSWNTAGFNIQWLERIGEWQFEAWPINRKKKKLVRFVHF